MKVRHRINKIVIAVPVCILAVYAGMHTHVDPAGKVKYELSEMLMEESQQIYLPGFAYTQGSRGSSFRDWGDDGGHEYDAAWYICRREVKHTY